jgi:hypothetical protein
VDRYWRSWLGKSARRFSWGSLACGAVGGALAVIVAQLTHTTITTQPVLDGLLFGFASWAVVKLSIEGYGLTPLGKVGLITSLGAAWMEADLKKRTEHAVTSWAEAAPRDTINTTVKVQYLAACRTKPNTEVRRLQACLADIATRLKNADGLIVEEADKDLRAQAAQIVIDDKLPRT